MGRHSSPTEPDRAASLADTQDQRTGDSPEAPQSRTSHRRADGPEAVQHCQHCEGRRKGMADWLKAMIAVLIFVTVLVAMGLFAAPSDAHNNAPVTPPTQVTEDHPFFNCLTDGNKTCGPDAPDHGYVNLV